MFWCNKTLVELDLVQHQISLPGQVMLGSASLSQTSLVPARKKSDVGLGLIQQVFIVVTSA